MAELEAKSCLLLVMILASSHLCSGQDVNCTEGELRLYGGSVASEGMLQQCNSSNQWSGICNHAWSCDESFAACSEMGFDVLGTTTFPEDAFGHWDSVVPVRYNCRSHQKSLQWCSTYPYEPDSKLCRSPDETVSLACHSTLSNVSQGCTHGDVRLVGGESESEGWAQVCYNGGWYSVCEMDDEEASVLCKRLGHTAYPWAALFIDGRFGSIPTTEHYFGLFCSLNFHENNWMECSKSYCSDCNWGKAIKCFDPGECEEGSLRLVDGEIDNEGRVEVCLRGVWGTIYAGGGWTTNVGYFVCHQLNLSTSKSPEVFPAKFGDGMQPQVMYYPTCSGFENSLVDCEYEPYGSFAPSRTNTAGILCFDDCEDGDVRLVGGDSEAEGTVELCVDSLWGLVTEAGWSLHEAQVICKQLGLPMEDAQSVNNSHYGKPRKLVHLSNVRCSGKEQQILSCTHTELSSLEEKKAVMQGTEVAGVICMSTTSHPISPSYQSNNNNNNIDGNNAPGDAIICATSGGQTSEGSLGHTLMTTIPNYLIALALFLGILVAIVGLVVYFKKKKTHTQTTKSSKFKSTQSLEEREGSLVSCYEIITERPPPPSLCTPAAMKTTAVDVQGNYTCDDEPVYEVTEQINPYAELSLS